ncbi:hypothetical protein DM860_008843 [Cuscuta australis]|uniref:Uncharacterized protein n=1 Tax=Cuscuta australis TaxID=267555 RepID=A0A328DBH6_9ASTE|nr:hypothetical protein DM860_008843 [Cuscuta australis]
MITISLSSTYHGDPIESTAPIIASPLNRTLSLDLEGTLVHVQRFPSKRYRSSNLYDTNDSYTELVPKTEQHCDVPTPTRESIPLSGNAMIGAVDSIGSPWYVDDNGIVIISQSKA